MKNYLQMFCAHGTTNLSKETTFKKIDDDTYKCIICNKIIDKSQYKKELRIKEEALRIVKEI